MATELQCAYCFDAIVEHIDKKEKIKILGVSLTEKQKFPLFVTWKKRSSSHSNEWRLRGCIGTFAPKELVKGLKEYAIISAFQDRRFPAVKLDEIPQLRCDVSLLTNFEPAEHYQDWVIGKHGLTIDFHDPITHAAHSATYLPYVAHEQGWDHITTIDELIAKSGYRGPITNSLRQNLKITRYQSSKASLTYDQYEAMRGKIS